MSRERVLSRERVWDLGPPAPVEPAPSVFPEPKGDDPDAREVRIRLGLKLFEAEYARYLELQAEYARVGGKPPRVIDVGYAKEVLERDAAAVAEGRQKRRRYFPYLAGEPCPTTEGSEVEAMGGDAPRFR